MGWPFELCGPAAGEEVMDLLQHQVTVLEHLRVGEAKDGESAQLQEHVALPIGGELGGLSFAASSRIHRSARNKRSSYPDWSAEGRHLFHPARRSSQPFRARPPAEPIRGGCSHGRFQRRRVVGRKRGTLVNVVEPPDRFRATRRARPQSVNHGGGEGLLVFDQSATISITTTDLRRPNWPRSLVTGRDAPISGEPVRADAATGRPSAMLARTVRTGRCAGHRTDRGIPPDQRATPPSTARRRPDLPGIPPAVHLMSIRGQSGPASRPGR